MESFVLHGTKAMFDVFKFPLLKLENSLLSTRLKLVLKSLLNESKEH